MREEVHVSAFDALQALEKALARFSTEALDALEAMEAEIKRRLETLEERKLHWSRQVRYWQRRYDEAEEDDEKEEILDRLEEAKEEFHQIHYWLKRVEGNGQIYFRQAEKMGDLATRQTPKARAFISQKLAELEAYVAFQAPESSYFGGVGTLSPTTMVESYAGERVIDEISISGSREEKERLKEALNKLTETELGRAIAKAIHDHRTTIRFGYTYSIAYFNSESNEIVINSRLRNASSEVLAAHLAHEGTHSRWNRPSSIDQEYHAFCAEAEIWNKLKGDQRDEQCDFVSDMISMDKDIAKMHIRRMYPELPEE